MNRLETWGDSFAGISCRRSSRRAEGDVDRDDVVTTVLERPRSFDGGVSICMSPR